MSLTFGVVKGSVASWFPQAANPVSDLLSLAVEGGSPRILFLQGLYSRDVVSELQVDGSSCVIPYAVDSP